MTLKNNKAIAVSCVLVSLLVIFTRGFLGYVIINIYMYGFFVPSKIIISISGLFQSFLIFGAIYYLLFGLFLLFKPQKDSNTVPLGGDKTILEDNKAVSEDDKTVTLKNNLKKQLNGPNIAIFAILSVLAPFTLVITIPLISISLVVKNKHTVFIHLAIVVIVIASSIIWMINTPQSFGGEVVYGLYAVGIYVVFVMLLRMFSKTREVITKTVQIDHGNKFVQKSKNIFVYFFAVAVIWVASTTILLFLLTVTKG